MHYRDLVVWQKSMELVEVVYSFTAAFPPDERFGLVSQLRRAAVSIPSNIAEGSRRRGKDGKHMLTIAYGSGAEVETQLELARRLKLGDLKQCDAAESLLSEVMRMLNAMNNRD